MFWSAKICFGWKDLFLPKQVSVIKPLDNGFIACQRWKEIDSIIRICPKQNYACQLYQPQDNGSKNDWVHIRFRGQAAHYSWENEPQNSP